MSRNFPSIDELAVGLTDDEREAVAHAINANPSDGKPYAEPHAVGGFVASFAAKCAAMVIDNPEAFQGLDDGAFLSLESARAKLDRAIASATVEKPTTIDEERLIKVTQAAGEAFWQVVADAYPEATTGDLSPLMTIAIDDVMTKSVREWVENNAIRTTPEDPEVFKVWVSIERQGPDGDYEDKDPASIGTFDTLEAAQAAARRIGWTPFNEDTQAAVEAEAVEDVTTARDTDSAQAEVYRAAFALIEACEQAELQTTSDIDTARERLDAALMGAHAEDYLAAEK